MDPCGYPGRSGYGAHGCIRQRGWQSNRPTMTREISLEFRQRPACRDMGTVFAFEIEGRGRAGTVVAIHKVSLAGRDDVVVHSVESGIIPADVGKLVGPAGLAAQATQPAVGSDIPL